jgi:predicted ester cyclase
MTRDEILALVKRRVAAYERRDAAALAATHAENGSVASPMGGVLEGRAEIERVYRNWFLAFPDITTLEDDLLIDGDRVVLIARAAGTHSGDLLGLPPTGRQMEVVMASLMTVADGFVVSERRIYDFTGLLVQIGVLKAKPSI